MTYINLTPRWVEILPTWLMIYRNAVEGNCTNPDLQISNTHAELGRMAEAADRYGDLVAALRNNHDYSDEDLNTALKSGR